MSQTFISTPILNSPHNAPEYHWDLDSFGQPTDKKRKGRRSSIHIIPIPRTKGDFNEQYSLDFHTKKLSENPIVNSLRLQVDAWRSQPNERDWKVAYPTERLLKHWRDTERKQRLFFCQLEAVETIIWLTEVAPRTVAGKNFIKEIKMAGAENTPDLYRLACKMATGSGKTVVMAMLIAWQAINKAHSPQSKKFSDAFLIVTPGITIRDRLRVLNFSDLDNYYEKFDLIPDDLFPFLKKARIVIMNFHTFQRRDTTFASKPAREILQGNVPDDVRFKETEEEMVARVCAPLRGRSNVIVINDEAHHCYRPRSDIMTEKQLSREEKEEEKKKSERANIWISGIEAVNKVLSVQAVYDLSATPFFLSGSGYGEGKLFGWVVSDFSLMDAIESGLVKIPRVPIADNSLKDQPINRNIYIHIKEHLPHKGRRKSETLDPEKLPSQLTGALQTLYTHYEQTDKRWKEAGHTVPPVFIVICNNTATSKLVYDYISGYQLKANGSWKNGHFPLFNNIDVETRRPFPLPKTLLVDSEQLDSGETMSAEFKKAAASEIHNFLQQKKRYDPTADLSKISHEDLLREAMNTVGKPKRLGERIRCVVSVSMLSEGWDVNTVTHILGIRAFGTQLLCEQVVGRALRRVSYKIDEETNCFSAEYADIFGVPFAFAASQTSDPPAPPPPQTHIHSVPARASECKITFPHVIGYRVPPPNQSLPHQFSKNSHYTITSDNAPSETKQQGITGEEANLTLDGLKKHRENSVAFTLAHQLIKDYLLDEQNNPLYFLFPVVLRIIREWMRDYLHCEGNTFPQYLLWEVLAEEAIRVINLAIQYNDNTSSSGKAKSLLLPILNAYNPQGTSTDVNYYTTRPKPALFPPSATKCHINYLACDGSAEPKFCQIAEAHPAVHSYIKNEGLGFRIPYRYDGQERKYEPDFIARVDDKKGKGPDDLLNLIVEIKGFMRDERDQAKADTAMKRWIPAVNNDGRFGRWDFVEITDIHQAWSILDKKANNLRSSRPATAETFNLEKKGALE